MLAALQDTPALALRYGIPALLRSFTYNRMPNAAEILKACGPARAELEFWRQSIERTLTLLDKEPP